MTENSDVSEERVIDGAAEDENCVQALAACREESEERLQALLRARADLDNQAEHAARELEKAHKYAVSGLVEALLPVQDSLELGLVAARLGADVETLRQGMALTLEKLQGVLAKFGVEVVDPTRRATCSMVIASRTKKRTSTSSTRSSRRGGCLRCLSWRACQSPSAKSRSERKFNKHSRCISNPIDHIGDKR